MSDEMPLDEKLYARAFKWREQHFRHVARLVAGADTAFAPSGSDRIRPELWKGGHWKWFSTQRPESPRPLSSEGRG